MFKTIRTKFVIIYFVLALIAIIIASVFIIKQIESLYINEAEEELNGVRHILLPDLENISDFISNTDEVNSLVNKYSEYNVYLNLKVWIIENNSNLVIATNSASEENFLAKEEYINAYIKSITKKDKISYISRIDKYILQIHPIMNDGLVRGSLVLRRDISDVFRTVSSIKQIIIRIFLALIILTVFLSIIISKSISDPIKKLTKRAASISKGNFENISDEIKSNDEIGELSETFNYMAKRLKTSLDEISLEKAKIEAIINNMTEGIITTDNNNIILLINPKAIHLLGLQKKDYLKKNLSEVLVISDIKENKITVNSKIIRVTSSPFLDRINQEKTIYVLQDITKENELENIRKEFVANVSHELKTPLTSIKAYTETLLELQDKQSGLESEFLKVIESESEKMSYLVRDLLELSNFDAKAIVFDIRENDYLELIKNIIRKISHLSKNKNVSIKLNCNKENYIYYFDYNKMEQVFVNIITNAIKYSDENSEVLVKIDEDDEKVIFSIKDNGIGIPKEDINRVFERFYRVDKARTRKLGGTGLGLSIVKEIVNKHNGEIVVKSEINVGSEFIVSIPKIIS